MSYNKNYTKVIAFDLDNTLCQSIRRNHPEDILKVKPKECSSNNNYKYWIDILKKLKKKGYKIIIFTRRGCLKNGRKLTIKWLKNYNIPYDKLITEKPHFDILIDDRVFSSYTGFVTPKIIESKIRFIKENCEYIDE